MPKRQGPIEPAHVCLDLSTSPSAMSVMSQALQQLDQAINDADFSALQQLIVELILQKQGHAFSMELAKRGDLSIVVARLLPLLQRWNQEQLATAGLNRVVAQLEQLTVPVAISNLARFAPGWYGIQGCRPSPGIVEIVILSTDGQWRIFSIRKSVYRHDVTRHPEGHLSCNYSFVGVFNVPDVSALQSVWINGSRATFNIENLSDSLYLDKIDDLLHLYRQARVPIDQLPELMSEGLYDLAYALQKPLKAKSRWGDQLRNEESLGAKNSGLPKISLVIPLFRRWHDFMQGHHAAFCMDPAFNCGFVEVVYVIDDPSIEEDVLNWARTYFHHSPYPIRIVSLRHNLGFGMASNIGVFSASTERIILMNSDVMPSQPGWLDQLDQTCSHHPSALVSPLLLYDNDLIQHAGMELGFSGNSSYPVPCNLHLLKGLSLTQLGSHLEMNEWHVPFLSGAVLAFSRELFLAIGGFEPIFGRGDFEDLDLSARWKQINGPLLICGKSLLCHLERQSINQSSSSESRRWQERFNACLALHINPDIQALAEANI